MPSAFITPGLFRFLKQLRRNNDREWFNANKQRYLDEVRDPLLAFVSEFGAVLKKISPNMVADPRPSGGSLFRIYRDTRFAKDKSPYKTHAAMSFRNVKGKDVSAPGFYLHLQPGRIFAGAGMWHPPAEALASVRDAIVDQPDVGKRATRGKDRALDDGGERLKRAPRGYDPEHPFVEDLKRKGFMRSETFTQKEVCAPDFIKRLGASCRRSSPLMAFLSSAVGVDW